MKGEVHQALQMGSTELAFSALVGVALAVLSGIVLVRAWHRIADWNAGIGQLCTKLLPLALEDD